jgi:hypothetical protein
VLEEEFVRLLYEFAIRGEFYFGFWAVAGAVENKDPLHRHFYVAFEVRNGVGSVERNTLLNTLSGQGKAYLIESTSTCGIVMPLGFGFIIRSSIR